MNSPEQKKINKHLVEASFRDEARLIKARGERPPEKSGILSVPAYRFGQSKKIFNTSTPCPNPELQSVPMLRFVQYYSRFDQARGSFSALPQWARFIVAAFAIPGLLLAALAILLLGLSVLALVLLTLPVYRVLKSIVPSQASREDIIERDDFIEAPVISAESSPVTRRPVEVRILDH
jgi:hypothetical protein